MTTISLISLFFWSVWVVKIVSQKRPRLKCSVSQEMRHFNTKGESAEVCAGIIVQILCAIL